MGLIAFTIFALNNFPVKRRKDKEIGQIARAF